MFVDKILENTGKDISENKLSHNLAPNIINVLVSFLQTFFKMHVCVYKS